MATNLPTKVPSNEFEQFDTIVTQIHQTFDTLFAELHARRDVLLLRLLQFREDYETKENTRKAGKEEIEQQIQLLSLRENINIPIHQEASDVYKKGLKQLETPTKLPYVQFICPTLYHFKSQIVEFGQVSEWEDLHYACKKEPILTVGKRGSGDNELAAAGIALDEDNQLIYITDYENKRVQVVSFEGKFIDRFGQDKLDHPWGIALTKAHVFITDLGLEALLQFDKSSYQFVKRTGASGSKDGQFLLPCGLCIDSIGDVFVADSRNNRVSVISKDFQFISNIGAGHLKKPKDVKITHDSLVVLDRGSSCIHFYSKIGQLIRSCFSRGDKPECLVTNPLFFCFDPAGNILITDFSNNVLKVVSQSEQLILTIGKKGEERGEFKDPYGVCITKTGTIFVVSENPNFALQSF